MVQSTEWPGNNYSEVFSRLRLTGPEMSRITVQQHRPGRSWAIRTTRIYMVPEGAVRLFFFAAGTRAPRG